MTLKTKYRRLSPLLKYPGGKEKELKYILPALPTDGRNYYDPFVGSGAVYLAIDADRYFINDKSAELMSLYRLAGCRDQDFFRCLEEMERSWQYLGKLTCIYKDVLYLLYEHAKLPSCPEEDIYFSFRVFLETLRAETENLIRKGELSCPSYLSDPVFWDEALQSFRNKIPRMKKLESEKHPLPAEDLLDNMEGCLKNAFYCYLREKYNRRSKIQLSEGEQTALYLFMREFCYSSMFRYNKQGDFNVPYGGITYNQKSLEPKIQALKDPALADQLAHSVFTEMDFEDFLNEFSPAPNDFMFLDPPYDTEFASYDGSEFGKKDHIRLASYLKEVCPCYFMLIIKNTDLIQTLYPEGLMTASGLPLHVYKFDKKYIVNFKARNDRVTEHLLITNYPVLTDMDFLSEMQGTLQ